MTEKDDFNRTVCACEGCRACCKRQPGSLAHGDFDRIVEWREAQGFDHDLAVSWVKEQLCASPGALVLDVSDMVTRRIGTIVPKMRKGRCVFLDENERCKIHAVAPFGCAYFDIHMTKQTAHPRSLWLVHTQTNPEYQELRATLPYAQSYRPTSY